MNNHPAPNLSQIKTAFRDYFKTFPKAEMHALKYAHTCRVVANAQAIIEGESERFTADLAIRGLTASWLHDIGRFKQFEKYGTFSDNQSVDHGLYSCMVTLELNLLDDLTPLARNQILQAIANHNKAEIPQFISGDDRLLAALVRDADKLDIFGLLDDLIQDPDYLPAHPEIYWHLPYDAPPSAPVMEALHKGVPIDYKEIKTFCDFVFIQLGWIISGLEFATSHRLVAQRHHIDKREAFLTQLLPNNQAQIHEICQLARAAR